MIDSPLKVLTYLKNIDWHTKDRAKNFDNYDWTNWLRQDCTKEFFDSLGLKILALRSDYCHDLTESKHGLASALSAETLEEILEKFIKLGEEEITCQDL